MIKKLLLFAAFIAVGFMAYSYRATILNHLTIISQPLQSAITQIQTAWGNIPEPYKGIANLSVIGGVPTALMMFFAWTKNRAMQKLQQTRQQASQQITGLNTQMQALMDERDTKIGQLEAELEAAKSNTSLQTSLSEAQNLVTQKQQEIHDLQLRFQGEIKALQQEIDRLRVKVHEVTVVK